MKNTVFITILLFIFTSFYSYSQAYKPESVTKVSIETDSGDIIIVLYNETSLHKANFIKLVRDKYYDGQLFHRLIKGFMIQGGDPNSKNAERGVMLGQGGPGYTIPAEIFPVYFHKKGSIAAARKGDGVNPSKSSSGSQFYIVQGIAFSKAQLEEMVIKGKHKPFTEGEITAYTTIGGSPHLDGGYTVFGEVISGIEVLDKLMNIPVDEYDRPVSDIKFTIKIIN